MGRFLPLTLDKLSGSIDWTVVNCYRGFFMNKKEIIEEVVVSDSASTRTSTSTSIT